MSSQSVANLLLATLNAGGLQRFFIAPGSRSQALAIAAAKLEATGKARATVRLDERSLGFTALGAAMASGKPVAVIVTSGTAVGNLMPAALEAHHSSVPVIFITADRPERLRGVGANQTLENQSGIFGFAARSLEIGLDATEDQVSSVARAALDAAGPVQINVQFDLPLSAGTVELPEISPVLPVAKPETDAIHVPIEDSMVVVAGAGGQAAFEFAKAANLPLIAEPSSMARAGSPALRFPMAALLERQAEITKVVVFGKPTLSRQVQALIASSELWVERSQSHGTFNPHGNAAVLADRLVPEGKASDEWAHSFDLEIELSERQQFVSHVWQKSDRLVLGASDLIRELDQVATPEPKEVFSNRGLAGIDGTVSTAIGIALERGETTLLLGDLTLLHDASGLNLTDIGQLPLRIVVGNDSGGHIFSRLEVAQEIASEQLSRFFVTPQRVDLAALASAYGWKYQLCHSIASLDAAWDFSGPVMIDYRL
ncbi:MAG: 2-succinyl-5-enolpyruvyl-6-hydroxy-3-cyclohexene-1-carboxylic-acid synthase [Aquiluna sp.]